MILLPPAGAEASAEKLVSEPSHKAEPIHSPGQKKQDMQAVPEWNGSLKKIPMKFSRLLGVGGISRRHPGQSITREPVVYIDGSQPIIR